MVRPFGWFMGAKGGRTMLAPTLEINGVGHGPSGRTVPTMVGIFGAACNEKRRQHIALWQLP